MTATTSSSGSRSLVLPNLDGLRACACLLVVGSHMPLTSQAEPMGAIGVAIFFVLSGFLMGRLYGNRAWDYAQVSHYCIARFARIAPIYWVVVSLCVVLSSFELPGDFAMDIRGPTQIARHYLFAGSHSIFWSIGPEVQFYGFFIFFWWAMARRAHRVSALPILAVVCTALLLTHSNWPGLALPNKLHLFLAGALAGMVVRPPWQTPPQRRVLALLQICALVIVAAPLKLYPTHQEMYAATELGIAFALAIYLLSIPTRWSTATLAHPVLRAIGRASFSIYLMHMLVFHFGMRWLGLAKDQFDLLWLPLGLAAVLLPMLVSQVLEMPLQAATRRLLERMLLPRVATSAPLP